MPHTNSKLPDICIRAFQPNDSHMVAEFFDQMGEETAGFFNRGQGNRTVALLYFTDQRRPHYEYFAATETVDGQERMAGYLFLWDTHRSVPWLGIAVRDCYKGMGLGTRLIAHARSYAIEHGKGGILLTTAQTNVRGQRLYEKSGYERLGVYDGEDQEYLYLLRF